MATSEETHKGEIPGGLNLADLFVGVVAQNQILKLRRCKVLMAGPVESLRPRLVAQPVADKVRVAGVDQDRDLLEQARHEPVVRLHPVAVEEEVAVDVKVARIEAVDLGARGLDDLRLVKVLRDVAQARVAQIAALALFPHVVHVLAGALVGTQQGVVAVDRGRDADPGGLGAVAALDHGLAARQSVVHEAAGRLVQNSGPATITAGHRSEIGVLGKRIGQTVANQNRLEVDVSLLVREDLRSKHRHVMSAIRFSRNMEVLMCVLGELLEEEREKGVDILARSHGVANRGVAVRIPNINRLVQEDDRGIGVPRVRVVNGLEGLVNRTRAELKEQSSHGRAAGAAVEPEDNGVILGIIARLEEPLPVSEHRILR